MRWFKYASYPIAVANVVAGLIALDWYSAINFGVAAALSYQAWSYK